MDNRHKGRLPCCAIEVYNRLLYKENSIFLPEDIYQLLDKNPQLLDR